MSFLGTQKMVRVELGNRCECGANMKPATIVLSNRTIPELHVNRQGGVQRSEKSPFQPNGWREAKSVPLHANSGQSWK